MSDRANGPHWSEPMKRAAARLLAADDAAIGVSGVEADSEVVRVRGVCMRRVDGVTVPIDFEVSVPLRMFDHVARLTGPSQDPL